ncbi:MAG: 4-hydroxy-tetrahydrodipicolinate synthase [Chloroflexi bacterium]|nr:4-hydroxy-tetrahydrodipicolinate synthase [Chloroflexota bacterium]
MAKHKEWFGVYVVVCTPFTKDEDLDEEALRRHIRFLLDAGVHGVIPTGSTSEFAALSEAERKRIVDITLEEVHGRVPVVVGTAAVSTRDTIMYSQYAEKAGADGVMIVPPYYCHPTEREIYGHYQAVAGSIRIPIMLYNNPWTSGVDMQPALIARLAEIENIAYIKESSGDMRRVSEIMRLCGDKMTIFCGTDNLALEMFAMGVPGWVAAPANAIPKQCVQLYELAVVKKDFAKAKELYFKMLPFFSALESGQFVQYVKASLEILGKPIGIPRRPLLRPAEEEIAQLKEILDQLPG